MEPINLVSSIWDDRLVISYTLEKERENDVGMSGHVIGETRHFVIFAM